MYKRLKKCTLIQCLNGALARWDRRNTSLDPFAVHLDHACSTLSVLAIVRYLDTSRVCHYFDCLSYYCFHGLTVDGNLLVVFGSLEMRVKVG